MLLMSTLHKTIWQRVHKLQFGELLKQSWRRVKLTEKEHGCEYCDGLGGVKTYRHQAKLPIKGRVRCIDWCIHHIVAALNAANVEITGSCCGQNLSIKNQKTYNYLVPSRSSGPRHVRSAGVIGISSWEENRDVEPCQGPAIRLSGAETEVGGPTRQPDRHNLTLRSAQGCFRPSTNGGQALGTSGSRRGSRVLRTALISQVHRPGLQNLR